MFLSGFGSPLLSMGRLLSKPAPLGTAFRVMTREHVVRIAFFLFALSLFSAALMVSAFYPSVAKGIREAGETARNIGFGAGVLGLSLALLTILYRQLSWLTAPVFALVGGVFMSGLALGFETRFPGIAVHSIFLTLAVFCSMLILYSTGIIKVSRKLFTIVYGATAAIALTYLASFLLLLFDITIPFIHGAGTGGILWFGFIVTVAAMNLVMDFDRIQRLDGTRQPVFMPWFVGLGLMVTLVWLYISVLRLLARIRR